MQTRGSVARRGGRLLFPWIVLAGCAAGSVSALTPTDFPFHALGQQLDLHWRLTRSPDEARVDGLAERRHADTVGAWLQLVGLDPAGRIVSFTTPLQVRWGSGGSLEPFTITLRPRGGEEQFAVRVQSFEYEEGMRGR